MSLRTRLIISYVFVIAIALTLAFLTLLLVARPLQNRLATARLATQSRLVAARLERMSYRPDDLQAWFDQLFGPGGRLDDVRLLVFDSRLTVLADTDGLRQGQTLRLPGNTPGTPPPETGIFIGPYGDRFNFAAQQIVLGGGRDPAYVAAVSPRVSVFSGVIADLGWGFLAAGGVALLMSLLLGIFIARSFARPLQRIAAAAGAVSAGNYEQRVPEAGPPEVRRVAISFNLMVTQAQRSQQTMRDFVSNVSHELKTPLTSIQGFSQAILEGATGDDQTRRRAAGIIHQEASRMGRMVEELLDLARLDSGQIVMQRSPLELASILSATVNRLLPQAAEKRITLVKDWPDLPQIQGDGDRLAQVFTNLLANAIHHTPPQGKIIISAQVVNNLPRPRPVSPGHVRADATTVLSARGNFIGISIADTGPGIPPDELGRIFERFYQVDKSRKRKYGAGLGLAISKEIVDAHGGYLRAESVAGVGSKFTALLPVKTA
jgi:two-component system OmpR family sensor kinase